MMDNDVITDLNFIKLLMTRDGFKSDAHYVERFVVSKPAHNIIRLLKKYYKSHPSKDHIDPQVFNTWARTMDPIKDINDLTLRETMVLEAANVAADESVTRRLAELHLARELETLAEDMVLGVVPENKVDDRVDKIISLSRSLQDCGEKGEDKSSLVEIDADNILDRLLVGDGLEWRLESLNKSVGPVHPTDVVLITKQPETGGTSFLVSEFTYMAEQLGSDGKAIIFHNEEGADKIGSRIIQSALNISSTEWLADPQRVASEWDKWKSAYNLHLYVDADLTTDIIEKVTVEGEYSLVGINVIEKVGLTASSKMEEVERLANLGKWVRHLATSKNVAVFLITQAGASADDKRWLSQADVYGSKTKMPSESDIMLGIGRDHLPAPGQENYRYIKVIRNKKPITHRMQPELKYGAFITEMNLGTGRYRDVATNS
ncbi:MAG: hypothetical protein D6711_03365 [Chloroflexi bacterium]|nr:MAG: hypothetical protein D6711_03365 [Chloroflexota bacterium]